MDTSETLSFIAKRIRALCDAANISVNDLAERSGLPTSTLHALLNCKLSNPRIASIEKVCRVFTLKLSEFWNNGV